MEKWKNQSVKKWKNGKMKSWKKNKVSFILVCILMITLYLFLQVIFLIFLLGPRGQCTQIFRVGLCQGHPHQGHHHQHPPFFQPPSSSCPSSFFWLYPSCPSSSCPSSAWFNPLPLGLLFVISQTHRLPSSRCPGSETQCWFPRFSIWIPRS